MCWSRLHLTIPVPILILNDLTPSACAHATRQQLLRGQRPRKLAKLDAIGQKLKPSRSASQPAKSLPPHYKSALGLNPLSQDAAPATRRSTRARQPSAHKLESDEYEASSRASSQPPSPAKPESKSQSKKNKSDKSGARPGRIVQPTPITRPTRDSSSPERLTASRPPPRDSLLDRSASTSKTLKITNKAEAIKRASSLLGYDVSRLSTETVNKVLTGVPPKSQATQADPMGLKGGSALAISQLAQGVVLGSQHQPPTAAANNADTSQGPSQPHAHSRDQRARDPPPVKVPPVNNDTATESESEPEDVELGPGDSVSQRLPLTYSSPPPLAYPHSPSVPVAHDPNPVDATLPLDDVHMDLDTGAINKRDGSDSDADTDSETELSEAVRALKRQCIAQPHRPSALSHRPNLSRTHSRPSTTRHSPPHSVAAAQPLVRVPSPPPVPPAAPSRNHTASTAPIYLVSSSQPPPISDVDATLAWAVREAGQPGNPNSQLARVLADLRRSQLVPSAAEPPAGTTQPRKRGQHRFVEDDSAVLEAEAALKLGLHVKRHQPVLADYPGYRRRIASLAIPELIAVACTQGAHKLHNTLDEWASKAYMKLWWDQLDDVPFQAPPPGLRGIMIHCFSWFRGEANKQVRTTIAVDYNFIDPPRTLNNLRYNHDLVKKLLPDAFIYPNLKPDDHPYKHPAIPSAIAGAFFWAPGAIGMAQNTKFNLIPILAVAMVLTMMEHSIKEWKTGRQVLCSLNAKKQAKTYEYHLTGLLEYAKPAAKQLAKFWAEWFQYGVAHAGGAIAGEDDNRPRIVRADRVRPDTPPVDV